VSSHRPSAGRHRRAAPRHRAPSPLLARLPDGDKGRAALLSATLGAALAVGVAGGTAAAAADRSASLEKSAQSPTPPDTDTEPGTDFTIAAASPSESLSAGPLSAGPPSAGPPSAGPLSAVPALRREKPKPKPKPVVTTSASWVNPNPAGTVTSCFGQRWGRLHAGVDIAGPDGSPILAAGAGVVVRAGVAEGYGNAVLIDHGNGYLTHYGHMSAIGVTVGQHVTAGEQIGAEGSTGHSTGPHLHFEVHQDHYKNPIEPTLWMHDHGVDIPGCSTS
jgi:murein DD-endopeptidase MepM/ murein hydrolase activator NlpD